MNAQVVHFYTFTGNPLAETTMEFNSWTTGKTQRARNSSFQMGGKGINVSKMLRRLGSRTTALSFLGGHTGEQCRDWLSAKEITFHAFSTRAPTRSGLVIRTPEGAETTFLGPDEPPDEAAWGEAARSLTRIIDESPARSVALAFCGSSPGWTDTAAQPFHQAIEDWLAAGFPLFVDSYGPPLKWFAQRPVDLIKINADELRGLMGTQAAVEELLQETLNNSPVRAWIVSDGPGPLWYAAKGESPRYQTPPVIREVSATGSGDVLLACLLQARLAELRSWDEAVRFAIPQASANAAHTGIAEF